jgi:hypothetical protein
MNGKMWPLTQLTTLTLISSFVGGGLLQGCAQPRYETNPDRGELGMPAAQSERATDCPLKLTNTRLCVSWHWEQRPSSSQSGSIVFKVYRGNVLDDTPVLVDSSRTADLLLWMPSMGHGSTPTQVQRLDVGTYRASNVFFIMPGDWELRFQFKEADQVADEATAQVRI